MRTPRLIADILEGKYIDYMVKYEATPRSIDRVVVTSHLVLAVEALNQSRPRTEVELSLLVKVEAPSARSCGTRFGDIKNNTVARERHAMDIDNDNDERTAIYCMP